MQTKLIIIRGNSGSGKTTTARILHRKLGSGTLLVSQDVVRREILQVKDTAHNLSVDLIGQIAGYGFGKCEVVIVEGILAEDRYGVMLRELIAKFTPHVAVYYYDLTFEETLNRNQKKQSGFGRETMQRWFLPHDYLNVPEEHLLTDEMTLVQQDVVTKILADIERL
ncbi:kinase [Lapidilactobacillus mulanensis]|uniref:Kinase n=1 Tax=Lapidilactobacillus mulanensis TaxID=2485999 RepID=A0ABW4DIU6_9LACO|nr:kinase [Lapidilactobacillus mulanensis]